MAEIYLNIAGFNIRMIFKSTEFVLRKNVVINFIKDWYRIYLTQKKRKPDFVISFSFGTVVKSLVNKSGTKMFINFYDKESSNKITAYYHLSLYQFSLVMMHILQDLLAKSEGFVFHGSASLIDDKVFVFMGKSGAGKSTTVKLLKQPFIPLADDSLILKKENNIYNFYQTPLNDKNTEIIIKNQGFVLGKIFFLKKAKFLKIEKISDKKITLQKLFKQLYSQQEDVKNQADQLFKLVNNFDNFYYLYFNKDSEGLTKLLENEKN